MKMSCSLKDMIEGAKVLVTQRKKGTALHGLTGLGLILSQLGRQQTGVNLYEVESNNDIVIQALKDLNISLTNEIVSTSSGIHPDLGKMYTYTIKLN